MCTYDSMWITTGFDFQNNSGVLDLRALYHLLGMGHLCWSFPFVSSSEEEIRKKV